MLPPLTASGSQSHDGVFSDAKLRRQIGKNAVVSLCAANDGNSFIVKNSFVAFFSTLIWISSMAEFVVRVFKWCGPSKICQSVIVRDAINMSRLMVWGGRWSAECNASKAMDKSRYHPAIYGERNLTVTADLMTWRKQAPNAFSVTVGQDAFDAPHVRNCIIRRFFNCAPFFIRIIGGIHSVSPYVRGQGRAVLDALLRPDLHSRFPLRSQTERAYL